MESSQRLRGKVAIVTGAGSSGPGIGTGKAISVILAREGAKVLLVDNNLSNAMETMGQISEEGGSSSVFESDITQSDDCAGMVREAIGRYGRLDILVNNVGVVSKGNIVDSSEEDWRRTLDVNLRGTMLCCKYAVPAMIKNGGGSIINIASIDAIRCGSWHEKIAYTASKGAVVSMSTSMAIHHGRDNIRVNCIAPGFIYTPLVAGSLSEGLRELRKESSALGTEGDAWDVAYAVLFLASNEARWITGIVLPVDGGLLAGTPLSQFPSLKNVQADR